MELNFTEILMTCTYFSTLCSKQARGPRGFCQHFGVSSRRFNNKSLMILSGIYNLHDVCELRDSWTGLYVAGTGEQHSRRERGDWTNENVQRQKGLDFGCTCLLIHLIVNTWEFMRTRGNVSVRSRSNWNLEVLVFKKRGKPEYPEENLSEQRREPTTDLTHIWRRRKD